MRTWTPKRIALFFILMAAYTIVFGLLSLAALNWLGILP